MRKCKQVISLILVLTMMFAILSVGIVQGAAADGRKIYADPPSEPALVGDVDRDGKFDITDVYVLRSSLLKRSGYIDYTNMDPGELNFKIANCYKGDEVDHEPVIDISDIYYLRCYLIGRPEGLNKGIGESVYPEPTTATITIYGLDGQSETKEFNVGDTFDVYTSLNVKNNGNDIQIASATYSARERWVDSETPDWFSTTRLPPVSTTALYSIPMTI